MISTTNIERRVYLHQLAFHWRQKIRKLKLSSLDHSLIIRLYTKISYLFLEAAYIKILPSN